MNEKLQYATMLEIPVSTCSVTVNEGKQKRKKRKKSVNSEDIKNKLITKINQEETDCKAGEVCLIERKENVDVEIGLEQNSIVEVAGEPFSSVEEKKKKRKFSFSIIGTQIAVIGVLIGTIFLTNAFYPKSGLNAFFSQVFSTDQTNVTVDNRTYKDFAPVLAVSGGATLEAGVITLAGKGSVYAPCDGKVKSVTLGDNGKYSLEIEHGKDFSTTVSGLDYAYCAIGDGVFANIPVGYMIDGGAKMCFLSGDKEVISDYTIDGNSIIWAV